MEPQSQFDDVIVGAGLSGLNFAFRARTSDPNRKILILEKSKSCGGRMATRRVGESKFDHGAQFIKQSAASAPLINFWDCQKVLRKFPSEQINAFCGISGMTQLSKKISESLNIRYNCKVFQLQRTGDGWQISFNESESVFSKNIILSSPLPQSLELLNSSGISFDPGLSQIHYSKAIVGLVEFSKPLDEQMNYQENFDSSIFSICSQKEKGLASTFNYTIVMGDTWSEDHFSLPDEMILQKSMDVIQSKFKKNQILHAQIKKWKYCQPYKIWESPFYQAEEGCFLIGDAFGGASLNGAIKSSNSLFESPFMQK